MGREHAEVPSPGVAAQTKLVRFVSEGVSSLHTLSLLVLHPGDSKERNFIGIGVVTTPSFVRPFVCQWVPNLLPNPFIPTHVMLRDTLFSSNSSLTGSYKTLHH